MGVIPVPEWKRSYGLPAPRHETAEKGAYGQERPLGKPLSGHSNWCHFSSAESEPLVRPVII